MASRFATCASVHLFSGSGWTLAIRLASLAAALASGHAATLPWPSFAASILAAASRQPQRADEREGPEVLVSRDERQIMVQAALRDERVGEPCPSPLADHLRSKLAGSLPVPFEDVESQQVEEKS